MNARQRRRLVLLAGTLLCLGGCTARDNPAEGSSPPAESHQAASSPAASQTAAAKSQAGPNRLARETSPYLRLHADNPVDWYPWGPEAFQKARQEEKPVFLSIGYSSCYWCHVMERLVFSDEEIAEYMNEHFVNIKVDREQRPDIDDIYMTALQAYYRAIGSPGGGGWPLSMFLTPEGKPFAGGTYFPPEDKQGRAGFPSVMKKVVNLWTNEREQIEANAKLLTDQVQRLMRPRFRLKSVELNRKLVSATAEAVKESYDPEHGGVGFDPDRPDAPKFPTPIKLAFLQYQAASHGDQKAADILHHTLDEIAAGGIRDHLGGGFHRYSTDRSWHVPHFEKMLYDQAQLAQVYLDAYRRTNKALYRRVAEETFGYVLRDLQSPQGGFYSARSAETDGIEGTYYVWTPEEVQRILGKQDADIMQHVYGMDRPKTFEHGYVLHWAQPLETAAEQLGLGEQELRRRLKTMRDKLLAARSRREAPLRDDKILTAWNGLMITALAHAADVLGEKPYLEEAKKVARFILSELRDEKGRLLRTYRKGQAELNGYLVDYAYLVQGLLALHQTTGEAKWLNAARRLTDDQIAYFWDEKKDGFFFTPSYHEELIVRTKKARDSVLPSGNSVSVRNLLRIASLSDKPKYRQYARKTLELFAAELKESPAGMTNMALALGEFLDQPNFAAAVGATSQAGNSPSTGSLSQSRLPKPEDEKSIRRVTRARAEEQPSSGSANQESRKDAPSENVLTAKTYLAVKRLPADGTCRILLRLDLQQGWHINANPAKPSFLVPTEVSLEAKHGTKLSEVKYPAPKKLTVDGLPEPLHVYEGQLAVRGVLTVPPEAAGKTERLQFRVRYQPCNEAKCLRPRTETLRGRIPVAPAGESVEKINKKLFSGQSQDSSNAER